MHFPSPFVSKTLTPLDAICNRSQRFCVMLTGSIARRRRKEPGWRLLSSSGNSTAVDACGHNDCSTVRDRRYIFAADTPKEFASRQPDSTPLQIGSCVVSQNRV